MRKLRLIVIIFIFIGLFVGNCDEENWDELSDYHTFLKVSSISPMPNQTNVFVEDDILITFSTPVKVSSFKPAFNISSTTGNVDFSGATFTWSDRNSKVRISGSTPLLKDQTIYNLRITTGLRSSTGKPLKENYNSTFITGGITLELPVTGVFGPNLLALNEISIPSMLSKTYSLSAGMTGDGEVRVSFPADLFTVAANNWTLITPGNYYSFRSAEMELNTVSSISSIVGYNYNAFKNQLIKVYKNGYLNKTITLNNYYFNTHTFGTVGSVYGNMSSPNGLALDSAGNLYVVDSVNNRVLKLGSTGTFISQWGSNGTGKGQFSYPQSVAIDSKDNIYIADTDNNRIQKFSSSGVFLALWGSKGSGDGQFNYPSSIALDSGDNVYVLDMNNFRIQKFNSSGKLIGCYKDGTYTVSCGGTPGTFGTGDGQFSSPRGLALDSSGNLYVSDTGNYRIQKFNATGTFQGCMRDGSSPWQNPCGGAGTIGSANGQFKWNFGVFVDKVGHIYVADAGNNRIQKFDSTGAYQLQGGNLGTGEGEFSNPMSVIVDSAGNIYVADTGNNRIQRFKKNF